MEGTISYTDTSPFSPTYRHKITIGDTEYTSIAQVIQAIPSRGLESMIQYITLYKGMYAPYAGYRFVSLDRSIIALKMEDILNESLRRVFIPEREPIQVARYIYIPPLGTILQSDVIMVPAARYTYLITPVANRDGWSIYRQDKPLDRLESYMIGMINGHTFYEGKQGVFILGDNPDIDMNILL